MAAPDPQAHAWKSFAKYVEKKNEVFPNFSHAPDKNVANGNNATSFSAAWLPAQLTQYVVKILMGLAPSILSIAKFLKWARHAFLPSL